MNDIERTSHKSIDLSKKDGNSVKASPNGISNEEAKAISHDIRNALTNLELALHHLKEAGANEDPAEHLYRIIHKSCNQIKDIANYRLK